MASGTIKSLRTEKGFGFIAREGSNAGDDVFFHHSSIANGGFETLQLGQRVTFEEGADPRDPSRRRATSVRLTDEG